MDVDRCGQLPNRGTAKDHPVVEGYASAFRLRHDLNAEQRIPAERKEVVLRTDARHTQHLRPDLGERHLGCGLRTLRITPRFHHFGNHMLSRLRTWQSSIDPTCSGEKSSVL